MILVHKKGLEQKCRSGIKEKSIQEAESQTILKLIKRLRTTTCCVQIVKENKKRDKILLGSDRVIILDIGI